MPNVFIAGVTGYLGSRLAEELIRGRHAVSGLVREGSENRLPQGCRPVPGNALDRTTFSGKIAGTDAYVQTRECCASPSRQTPAVPRDRFEIMPRVPGRRPCQ